MDQARVEHIARALCRAARMDPDAPVEAGGDVVTPHHSAAPGIKGKPTWFRFLPAAKAYCEARDVLGMSSASVAKV